jgi:hypothetical protein
MNTILLATAVLILACSPSYSQQRRLFGLPAGAQIVETQSLNSQLHPDRALILWMLRPKKNPREAPGDNYSCPENTRGSYYSGPTRASLVNSKTHRVINTVKVIEEYLDNADSFDIPYRIKAGMYYHVGGVPNDKEGKPTIMWLRDYNGDDKSFEFALYDAMACMGLETTLIGYSERQDKVVQYPVQLKVKGDDENGTRISHWCDYLFSEKPNRPGFWKYEIDYRGRAGSLDRYEVRYDAAAEMFKGTYVWTAKP